MGVRHRRGRPVPGFVHKLDARKKNQGDAVKLLVGELTPGGVTVWRRLWLILVPLLSPAQFQFS